MPVWLKLAYLLFLAVWIPAYWLARGPEGFLWLCDVANILLGLGLLLESPLLVSSQAVGMLLVQSAWVVDVDAVNWVWRPFGVEQVWMPTWAWVGVLMVAYPACLFLPTHGLLAWWTRRDGGPAIARRPPRRRSGR